MRSGIAPTRAALFLSSTKAEFRNQLLTIPGGAHGGFSAEHYAKCLETIRTFLAEAGVIEVKK